MGVLRLRHMSWLGVLEESPHSDVGRSGRPQARSAPAPAAFVQGCGLSHEEGADVHAAFKLSLFGWHNACSDFTMVYYPGRRRSCRLRRSQFFFQGCPSRLPCTAMPWHFSRLECLQMILSAFHWSVILLAWGQSFFRAGRVQPAHVELWGGAGIALSLKACFSCNERASPSVASWGLGAERMQALPVVA